MVDWIKQAAHDLGFDLVGIAQATDPFLFQAVKNYTGWIERGGHASMEYLKRHTPVKANPELFLPEWRSVICVGLLYADDDSHGTSSEVDADTIPYTVKISQYTRGEDYHHVLRAKLDCLAKALEENLSAQTRSFVDSEPVLERFWAWRAGLGWLGKNTCLIHRKLGSYLFLGGLLTTLELTPDAPQPDHCGKCRKCIDACPTHAIIEPTIQSAKVGGRHWIDSNKCIAYHTIENRSLVPEKIMEASDRWIAGCDICQSVCPWNDPITPGRTFQNSNPAFKASLTQLAGWTESDFKTNTKEVAMGRMKYAGFLRNLLIAISNSELPVEEKKKVFKKLSERVFQLPVGVGRDGAFRAHEWAMGRMT